MHAAHDMQALNRHDQNGRGYCQKWRREVAEMKADMGLSLSSGPWVQDNGVQEVQDSACTHAVQWTDMVEASPFSKDAANGNVSAQAA